VVWLRIIDLSVPTEESASEALGLKVTHLDHRTSVSLMTQFFDCGEDDLPEGLGWANDEVTLFSHSGTHVDAPWHYYPTCGGRPARKIDELPLEWFFSPGVVLDFRNKEKGSKLQIEDFQRALHKIGYALNPGDIVLVQTGADKLWGQREYFDAGCGVSAAATSWLIDQGIRVMGIDAWSWDRPFWAAKDEFQRTRNPVVIWEAHRVGMKKEYCHIEKLANLDRLPTAFGFTVASFPVRLAGGSAAWCRTVAIVEEGAP